MHHKMPCITIIMIYLHFDLLHADSCANIRRIFVETKFEMKKGRKIAILHSVMVNMLLFFWNSIITHGFIYRENIWTWHDKCETSE